MDILQGRVVSLKKNQGVLLVQEGGGTREVNFILPEGGSRPVRRYERCIMAGEYDSKGRLVISKVGDVRAVYGRSDIDILAKNHLGLSEGELAALLKEASLPNLLEFMSLYNSEDGRARAEEYLVKIIGPDRGGEISQNIAVLNNMETLTELKEMLKAHFDIPDILKVNDFLRYRASRCHKTVFELLREDPFHLVHVPNLSKSRDVVYKIAEELAEQSGVSTMEAKVAAAASIYLWNAAEKGHVYGDTKKVLGFVYSKLLGKSRDNTGHLSQAIANTFYNMLYPPEHLKSRYSGWFCWDKSFDQDAVYLRRTFFSEYNAAKRLSLLLSTTPDEQLDGDTLLSAALKHADKPLDSRQQEFIKAVAVNKVVLLDGEAGTGKTTALAALAKGYRELTGRECVVLAPTGVASKRLSEKCEADLHYTIHRFAQIDETNKDLTFDKNDYTVVEKETHFQKEREITRWNAGLILVDEMSMTDIVVFYRLLNRVLQGSRIVFAGDSGQLPPVGPGAVFKELLVLAGEYDLPRLARISLTKSHRNRGEILMMASKVRSGAFADIKGGKELRIIDADPDEVYNLFMETAIKQYKENGFERVMALTPYHLAATNRNTQVGADIFNYNLKKALNPGGELLNTGLSPGDVVMAIRNDYAPDDLTAVQQITISEVAAANDKNNDVNAPRKKYFTRARRSTIFNGTKGLVAGVKEDELTGLPCLVVRYFGQNNNTEAMYYPEEVTRYIELAYASTVHKAQGGEADYVIFAVDGPTRWANDLFYTAITRAKKGLFLIGPPGVWQKMAEKQSGICRSKFSDRLLVDLGVKREKKEKSGYRRSATTAPDIIPYVAASESWFETDGRPDSKGRRDIFS